MIVADFNIVAIDGTRLCTLTQVEVQRHESSPSGGVTRRHDVVFQPLAIPATAIEDQDVTIFGHENMRQVYKYLDHLASEAIAATLRKKPRIGTAVIFDLLIPVRLPIIFAARPETVYGLCGYGCRVARFLAAA